MTRLRWDLPRLYEHGLDRGVFYPPEGPGEAWNGLVSVDDTTEGSELSSRYIDGVKTYARRRPEEFAGTIQAYTYPEALYSPLTDDWRRSPFGLSYRTLKVESSQIHLVYNVTISPAGFSHEQSETDLFSWDFSTHALEISGAKRSAHLIVDTSNAYSWTTTALEDLLYGSDVNVPQLPTPAQVLEVFDENSILRVYDNGDGTYTVEGPDEAVQDLGSGVHRLSWPSVVYLGGFTYRVSSL